MSSNIVRRLMIPRRARLWVPLALLSALPISVLGDEPSRMKPTAERPAAAKAADSTKQPPVSTRRTALGRPLMTQAQAKSLPFSVLPDVRRIPQTEAARPRDLLYRGENAGPYHAIYLQGVPPGVRIKGVTPPPINEPRIHLVLPKAKAAPGGKSSQGEKK